MKAISRHILHRHVDERARLACLGQMLFAEWLAWRRRIEATITVADEHAVRAAYAHWATRKDIGPAEEDILWKRRFRTVHRENGFGAADLRRERWGGAA